MNTGPTTWITNPSHHRWLERHACDLLEFARNTADPRGGAYWLGTDGTPDTSRPTYTWITCRMAHVYGIGALLAVPGTTPIAQSALAGLMGRLHDTVHGGWYHAVDGAGRALEPIKSCYDHAFVLTAASTAVEADLTGAEELFDKARHVLLGKFWDDSTGLCVDTWDTTFTTVDAYRGINSNMHAVEAALCAAGVSSDADWTERARAVCRFVATTAEAYGWRIPEHYDANWKPLLDFNHDQPAHPFKPFGATIGHGLEWARLCLNTEAACGSADNGWLVEAAEQLFDRAVTDGWAVDGNPGFVYTSDWSGTPVVRDRLHWVVAEAVGAAATLYRRTGDMKYGNLYQTWWDYADQYLIDHQNRSWIHQLDAQNRPAAGIWAGKPDIYHAFQAALSPRLPSYPMIATAVGRGQLG